LITLKNALSATNETGNPSKLQLDTVFKVQDLANSLDFLGSVALYMGFSLQSWDYTTIGQDQNALELFKLYQNSTIWVLGDFLDKSTKSNPFPSSTIS